MKLWLLLICVAVNYNSIYSGGPTVKDSSLSSMSSSDSFEYDEDYDENSGSSSSSSPEESPIEDEDRDSKESDQDSVRNLKHKPIKPKAEGDFNLLDLDLGTKLALKKLGIGLPDINLNAGAKIKSPVELPTLLKADTGAKVNEGVLAKLLNLV